MHRFCSIAINQNRDIELKCFTFRITCVDIYNRTKVLEIVLLKAATVGYKIVIGYFCKHLLLKN